MIVGIKNKLIIFITLFGVYNIIVPIFTETTYDPNNFILLAVSIIAFGFFLFSKRNHDISLLAVLGIVVFSFIFIALGGNSLSLSYYTKWVIFTISLFFYYITLKSDDCVANGNYKLLYFSVLLQVVLFVIDSLDSNAYTVMRSGTYFISCFDNKNSTAMHLLTLCCILILCAERKKAKEGKRKAFIPLVAFAICFYLIILTGSRSSLVGALFIIPFYFFPKIKKVISKPIILMFIALPFLFASIYVALYNSGYGDLELFGRTIFNGRQDLWIRVFEGDFFGWVFGMYSDFARPDGIPFQLHNGTIDLIATYGIIITFAFLTLIYKLLSSLYDSGNEINRMIVVCVCALILQSIGEAALFNGTRVVYICMILMFIERKSNNGIERIDSTITKNRIEYSA